MSLETRVGQSVKKPFPELFIYISKFTHVGYASRELSTNGSPLLHVKSETAEIATNGGTVAAAVAATVAATVAAGQDRGKGGANCSTNGRWQ